MDSIYGSYGPALDATRNDIIGRIQAYSDDMKKKTGEAAYEHLIYRIKSENSMATPGVAQCRLTGSSHKQSHPQAPR